MKQNEIIQPESIKPDQIKSGLFLSVTFIFLVYRIMVLAFNKFDIQSVTISRSFLGNGFLSRPLISELLISILVILMFFQKGTIKKPLLSDLKNGLLNTLLFLAFPVITGLCLFTFKQDYIFKFRFNELLMLRWICFSLTFVAINLIFNVSPFRKFIRWLLTALILILTCVLQDFTSDSNSLTCIYAVLSGVGMTLALSVIAFRNAFKKSFWSGVFSALFTGLIVCFFVFGAISNSVFTLFLPFVAMVMAAISFRRKLLKTRLIYLCSVSLVSLLLSLFLPSLFPPDLRGMLQENKNSKPEFHEQVSGIQINYDNPAVKEPLTQIARVLQAANQVSQETFGISPGIEWITISGIGPGGFNAVFPHGISGRFISQQYINDIQDSTFLNDPGLSCQFPDPVNSILHEYSHLYGLFPYQKWVSTESEGWATYSATRLSRVIYQKYGPSLWHPAYNYSKIADSINSSLLAGHPLIWSHPEEVEAFKLWNYYEQKEGLKKLYNTRWQYTSRDRNTVFILENNPDVALGFIDKIIGKDSFSQFSASHSVSFSELYNPDDWRIMGRLMNKSDSDMQKFFDERKTKKFEVNVPEPVKNKAGVEIGLTICLLLLFALGKTIRI
jgi:hypothetical protein